MARTLSTYVSLWGEAAEWVTLAPGDELPGWAVGRVGEHCLVPAEDSAEDQHPADSDADGDTDDEAEGADGEELALKDAAPDFTAAAPRRGRSRK